MMHNLKIAILTGFLFATLGSCSEGERGEGEEHYQAGRYEQAIEAYTKTLQINPNDAELLYKRGRAYSELENYDASIEDLKSALKFDDKNVRFLLSLGDVFYKQGEFDNALYYYELATEEARNNPNALYKRAKANHMLGNIEEAMDSYAAALRENNEMGEAYLSRAALKISQDDRKGACEDLRKAENLGTKGASEALAKYCS